MSIFADVSTTSDQSLWEKIRKTWLNARINEVVFLSKSRVLLLLRSSTCHNGSVATHALTCKRDSYYYSLEEVHTKYSLDNCHSFAMSWRALIDDLQKCYMKNSLICLEELTSLSLLRRRPHIFLCPQSDPWCWCSQWWWFSYFTSR